jgi:hypothetical protein
MKRQSNLLLILTGVFVLAIVFELGGILNKNNSTSQIIANTPQTQPSIQTQYSDLDLQTKCEQQAQIFTGTATNGGSIDDGEATSVSWTNHWNKSLGKCFINETVNHQNTFTRIEDLYDAVESTHYASFTVSPNYTFCSTSPTGDLDTNPQKCTSESQYNNFVKPYMTN